MSFFHPIIIIYMVESNYDILGIVEGTTEKDIRNVKNVMANGVNKNETNLTIKKVNEYQEGTYNVHYKREKSTLPICK